MLSFYNIRIICRFEIKTLMRSWFFRIFSGISIVILFFFNMGIVSKVGNSPWMFKGISSLIPYMNLLLLNVVQAIIAVFLASDFLKRDKKLDTTEVIYMRSMTNGDYVIGKTIGILLVFMVLNGVILFVPAIFNIFFSQVPINIFAYVIYPFLISLPTLIYIFGLSFLFMVVIRNQAVTFIVLLGYIASTLFFLSKKLHHIFDYMAFNVPLTYSDFVGFGDLDKILIHRGIYLLLGLGFIFVTILLLKRLPQSIFMMRLSFVLSILFVCSGVVTGYQYLLQTNQGKALRQNMIVLNEKLANQPHGTPLSCKIDLQHLGDEIECEVTYKIKNNHQEPLDRYIFSLNPGFRVSKVTTSSKELQFKRNLQILTITPNQNLKSQAVDSVTIHYRGKLNEEACYLDISEKTREMNYRIWLYVVDKRYGFISKDYVLLTPATMWYPLSGIPYDPQHPESHEQDFIQFRLHVKTSPNLLAVSQGQVERDKNGEFLFTPKKPVPQISLAIGNYKTEAITADSVEYRLLTLKKHRYYQSYFKETGDTLAAIIKEAKQDFERKLDLTYRYPRLSLIEVPIQFFSYPRIWSVGQETVQPETIYLPENGLVLQDADFSRMKHREERRRERSNQVFTAKETEVRLFQRFVRTFLEAMSPDDDYFTENEEFMQTNWGTFRYSIYPTYYHYTYYVASKEWSIFNLALESYLSEPIKRQTSSWQRYYSGLTLEEKTNLVLNDQNLEEFISNPAKKDLIYNVLNAKGSYLFKLLQSKIGADVFQEFLVQKLQQNPFRKLNLQELIASIRDQFHFNFNGYLNNWYESKQLPGFILTDFQAYKIIDNNRTRYQVRFVASNFEPVEGLVVVSFRMGRGGRFSSGDSDESEIEQMIFLSSEQAKEVGIVLDQQPRSMSINTLISKNIPSILTRDFEDFELNKKAAAFDGERVLEVLPQISNANEIIVDNEDQEFVPNNPPSKSLLKRWLKINTEPDEKYTGIRWWNISNRWFAATNSEFYGKYVRSAYYTRGGDGDMKVTWNAKIAEAGFYDLYYFASNATPSWFRRRSQDRGENHFTVYHEDGTDEVLLETGNADHGWNYLGSYYLAKGNAEVDLTNESKSRLVFADAIKWVKR